ncbi:MAG: flavodoxin domain-containing protein [Pseudothermotoga sp.]
MKNLIVYDSYTGTVEKCAEILAKELGNTDLMNISKQKLPDLKDYDCIVIGSYIHAGHVSKKIKRFTEKNLELLKNKKVGVYLCMLGQRENFEQYINYNFDKGFLNICRVKDFFGGELNYGKMNFFFRLILRKIEKSAKPELGIKLEKIREFAQELKS